MFNSKTLSASSLTKRGTFSEYIETTNEYGEPVREWVNKFTTYCQLHLMKGGDEVIGLRLVQKSPGILTVRANTSTQTIKPDWQVTIDGRMYYVRELPRETPDRMYLEMLVESRQVN